ncbi:MAG: Exoglucanase A, partial [Candidatus Nomurabacteria bacterium GW2011_GWA2_40_97]
MVDPLPSFTPVSISQINLTWNISIDNVGVTGYRIYRDGNQIATTTAASYSDNGLTPNTNYSYTVSAYDAVGNESGQSGTVNTTTLPDTQAPSVSLTAPSQDATVLSTISVNASASDDVGVVGVQFKLDGVNLDAEDLATPYSITWDTTTATNGTHMLTAFARDVAGNTTTSATVNVTVNNPVPDTQAPSVPSGLSVAAVSETQINLSWNASTDNVGVTGYNVYQGGNQIATTALTLYSNIGLIASTTYSYTVSAFDLA